MIDQELINSTSTIREYLIDDQSTITQRATILCTNRQHNNIDSSSYCYRTQTIDSTSITSIAIDRAHNRYAIGDREGCVRVYDLATMQQMHQFAIWHNGAVNALCFGDEHTLISVGRDGRVGVYDCRTFARYVCMQLYQLSLFRIATAKAIDADEVLSAACVVDHVGTSRRQRRRQVLIASWNGRVYSLTSTHQLLPIVELSSPISCIDAYRSTLAIATWNGSIVIYSLETNRRLHRLRVRSSSTPVSIRSIRFICDGEQLISIDIDGRMRIWSIATAIQLNGIDDGRVSDARCAVIVGDRQLATIGSSNIQVVYEM